MLSLEKDNGYTLIIIIVVQFATIIIKSLFFFSSSMKRRSGFLVEVGTKLTKEIFKKEKGNINQDINVKKLPWKNKVQKKKGKRRCQKPYLTTPYYIK